MLGALNAIAHEMMMVTNDTYITADSVCDRLRRVAMLNLDVPITLVMDNARNRKCNIVTALASQLNIELLYLPAYSPNLNLIERLWKFVKEKSSTQNYPNFAEFQDAITDCLKQTHTAHKKELDSR